MPYPRPARSLPWAVLDRPEGHKVPAGRGRCWVERVAPHFNMTPKCMLTNASWSTALVSVSSPFCLSFPPLPLCTLLSGLQHLNHVAHPDRAVFDYPRADTTTTLQGLRHTRFGKTFDVAADRARPPVIEDNLPDEEPLATSRGLQAYPSGDDVAPVLAVLHTDAGLSLDIVEVLGCDEGYFADPAEAAPVPGPCTVAITLQTATFERGSRLNALHLCTSFRRKEYAFHELHHHQSSFKSCPAFRRVLRYPGYPGTVISGSHPSERSRISSS